MIQVSSSRCCKDQVALIMRLSTLLPAIGLFPYASFVRAFDAGITPPEAYVKDGRAFRHGDIVCYKWGRKPELANLV